MSERAPKDPVLFYAGLFPEATRSKKSRNRCFLRGVAEPFGFYQSGKPPFARTGEGVSVIDVSRSL
jgi:hypothetical protein